MILKPALPMPPPDLTPALWMQFFTAAQKLGLRAAGTRIALALLAHPDGLPSESLDTRPRDIHRLSCYARRPAPWVEIELVRYESNGTRRVRYHAAPALHAALAVPPLLARRMHRHLEAWIAACEEAHIADGRPLHLLVMLVTVAAHHPVETGFPASRKEFRTVPFLVQSRAYQCHWDRLTAVGMLRCQPGRTPRYWITDAGRRALGLIPRPAAISSATPARRVAPYVNRAAA